MSNKKLAIIGIVIGITLASIANDEIIILQAKNQEQKNTAQFYIGVISFVSGIISLSSIFGRATKSRWVSLIRGISSSVTLTSIVFLTFLPKIYSWLNP